MITLQAATLVTQLQRLEGELRCLGLWAGSAPSPEALASTAPFCVDSLALDQWLQWIFIPRMRAMIDAGATLPDKCAITEVAEMVYQSQDAEYRMLFSILRDIDRLLTSA